MQPDRGRLCTFWLAALVGALGAPRGTTVYGAHHAVSHLLAFFFLFTGHAVPTPLRAPLLNKLAALRGRLDAVVKSQATDGESWRRLAVFVALRRVLATDAVFAPLLEGHALNRPFSLMPNPVRVDTFVWSTLVHAMRFASQHMVIKPPGNWLPFHNATHAAKLTVHVMLRGWGCWDARTARRTAGPRAAA
jgi:hypothetical protein